MTDKECAADANKLWQQAHNKPDTLPDIGVLINWLVSEIENKQYTITCAAEENQQLKESLVEARAEIESLTRSLTIVANWKNVKMTYTADEVKEFARGILDVAALEAAERSKI